MATLADRARELKPPAGEVALRAVIAPLVCIAFAVAMQLWVKPMLGDFYAKLALDIGTNVILAVSLTIVNGFTGQFSIGHAAFMAVGGYTAAALMYYGSARLFGTPDFNSARAHAGALSTMLTDFNAPWFTRGDGLFLASLLVGGLVAGLCGYVVGLPSLRLRGDYLAIVTLGFGEIVRVLIQSQTTSVIYTVKDIAATPVYQLPRHVGGALGFSGLPSYTSLFWVWLLAGVTLLVAFRLKESTFGRAFLSIREDEIAAEAMGVKTTRYKVWAFVIAAFFAGIAGGLFAHTSGVQLNAAELGFQKSFDIIIMVVLGGLGSISGATIAAVILTLLPELLRDPPSAWPWGVVGGVVLALIIAMFSRNKARPFVYIAVALGVWELVRWGAALAGIELSSYRMVLYALLLISMMIARPSGLLGVREIWELRMPGRRAPRGGGGGA
jgi:branched-chain amino acid transport system permease protein